MANVTYLLGAGASCGKLPVVANMPQWLYRFKDDLTRPNSDLKLSDQESFPNDYETKAQRQEEFCEAIQWLITESSKYASVDTFAKKLFLMDRGKDLNKLKAVLTLFFIYEQLKIRDGARINVDERYDTFFASLLIRKDGILCMPEHLKIISWNYDFQFEKAYSAFLHPTVRISNIQENLNIIPHDWGMLMKPKPNEFAMFKLNGTTAIIPPVEPYEHRGFIDQFNVTVNREYIESLIQEYNNMVREPVVGAPKPPAPAIKFAWEDTELSSTNSLAKQFTALTNVLVIIGYSFPFFNREIDKDVIGNMKGLKKVYFQSLNEDEAQKCMIRFRSIIPDIERLRPELIGDSSQFFLPPEL